MKVWQQRVVGSWDGENKRRKPERKWNYRMLRRVTGVNGGVEYLGSITSRLTTIPDLGDDVV